jgi:hypothetical protein
MCCFASSYGKIEALPGGKKESHYKIVTAPLSLMVVHFGIEHFTLMTKMLALVGIQTRCLDKKGFWPFRTSGVKMPH